jgi:hypothetical protein
MNTANHDLSWAEIAMRLDLCETGIATASTCHPYFIRDGIKAALLAELKRISEESK